MAARAAARAAYQQIATEAFGNPSSLHPPGQMAASAFAQARARVATFFGAVPDEVVFTSGGTESNALALLGVLGRAAEASDGQPPQVVTTTIEHPSVAVTLRRLEAAQRAQVCWVPAGKNGAVEVDGILDAVTEATCLVSAIAASNETGVVQPIAELSAALSERGVPMHIDAVQAVGKVSMGFEDLDHPVLISCSGHKVGAVAGIGCLIVRGVQLQPLLVGGGQERGRRGSTENVAGAASLAAALGEVHQRFSSTGPRRDQLERGLRECIDDIQIVGETRSRLPNTSLVRFVGCPGDAVMMALDQRGIAVSTGSACSSGSVDPSPVLLAMGYDAREAREAVRFSLDEGLTDDDVDRVVEATREVVLQIRRLGSDL